MPQTDVLLAYATGGSVITPADAKRLTHLNLAFTKIDNQGGFSCDHPLQASIGELRELNPRLKIISSIIPAQPDAFTVCAADPELRVKAARNCAAFLNEYGYDGVDFDWEYPCVPSNGVAATAADKPNFTAFLRETRNAIGPDKLLTIAAGADVYYCESVDIPSVSGILDFINLMTYDLKCGFHALSGHHTNLFSSTGDYFHNSCARAMRLFEAYGAPKEKLVMGAAFYSRKWDNVPDFNGGYLQLTPKGGGYGPGYATLAESYIDKNGYVRHWDDESKAPYLFNGDTFISYDDPESIAHKCDYVKSRGFRGLFYWEHASDPSGILLEACYKGLFE
ncbi:MAG: chitinase [Oscillospiraceae bacterium]|jgi:chitinase|nr:chitinase [Oscillospiraceae bacterium]